MYEVIKAGGFTKGGLNFDAKTRRPSNTPEDIFHAYIAGMDAFALGLRAADKIIRDGRLDAFVRDRYASYESGIGKKIVDGSATMAELEAYALAMGDVTTNASGKQEYLENLLNGILFGN
jgi:xylose isomerase